jgi:hypothetical protein
MPEIKTLHCFFSSIPSINFILKNGKQCAFVDGAYYTDSPAEIEELTTEISAGHPHLYIKKEQETIESNLLDPMEALKAKFFAEFAAQQAAATEDPTRDMGESETQKLQPGNTNNIAEAAAGGSGAARLLAMAQGSQAKVISGG